MKHLLRAALFDWHCTVPSSRKKMIFWTGIFTYCFLQLHDNLLSFMCVTWLISSSITLPQTFAAAEKNNTATLYATLGITRVETVLGRYLLLAVVPLVIPSILLALGALKNMIAWVQHDQASTISVFAFYYVTHTVCQAVLYPLLYRHGYVKARNVLLIAALSLAICDVILFLPRGFSGFAKIADAANTYAWTVPSAIFALLISATALGFSSYVSCRVYLSKDFMERVQHATKRPWGSKRTTRYLVSSDGSIFKLESTRKVRAHDLSNAARLPASRRRTRTAQKLAALIKAAQRRNELALDRQTDRRVMQVICVILALLIGGTSLIYVRRSFFSASFLEAQSETPQSITTPIQITPGASGYYQVIAYPEVEPRSASDESSDLGSFILAIGLAAAIGIYAVGLMNDTERPSDRYMPE